MTITSKNKAPKPGDDRLCVTYLPNAKAPRQAPSRQTASVIRGTAGIGWPSSHVMSEIDPGENHHVRVDAGHVRINYQGWRYIADAPRHVKRSLMLFDKKLYEQVHIRAYTLRFRRTTKIVAIPRERQDQINAARKERAAAGYADRRYPNLRKRVEGFSGIV